MFGIREGLPKLKVACVRVPLSLGSSWAESFTSLLSDLWQIPEGCQKQTKGTINAVMPAVIVPQPHVVCCVLAVFFFSIMLCSTARLCSMAMLFVPQRSADMVVLRELRGGRPLPRLYGHVPGVRIGDTFNCKGELAIIGVHRQIMRGIDQK